MMDTAQSKYSFEEAKKYIPGGVNSPVRAFSNIGAYPLFIDHAKGSKIYDIDGNEYIDYVGSWGPMLLGHAHPKVVDAVISAAYEGTSFGAPSLKETELAKKICSMVHCVDKVRMVNSGTEATMSAIRLARGYTGRNTIVKFEGCYHGHCDSLLIKTGSGALTHGVVSSAGVPDAFAKHTIVLPYNDIYALNEVFSKMGEEISCVIVEPVAGNMGVVLPQDGFLQKIRELTLNYGSIFIVDEVMTGFRLSPSGAIGALNLSADIVTFGKVIGGGLPVGAYGGRCDIMDFVSPSGPVYQAGTLSGNPIAMAAGIAMLSELDSNPSIYGQLEEKSAKLEKGLKKAALRSNIDVCINRMGSMLSVFFTKEKVIDFKTACTSDTNRFKKYFLAMLDQGIYLAPSQFEAIFVSNAHTDEDIDKTINAAEKAMSSL
ncbi:MAG: glutamate-1-semialdehyde 2,1-aminomutase [Clostridia bacterium]|nr:glutamate-1-semialdehyde 2,1-aminomutase [Clostridia bacterium]